MFNTTSCSSINVDNIELYTDTHDNIEASVFTNAWNVSNIALIGAIDINTNSKVSTNYNQIVFGAIYGIANMLSISNVTCNVQLTTMTMNF